MPSMPRIHTKTASDLLDGHKNFQTFTQLQNDPNFKPSQKTMYDLNPPHQRNIVHPHKWKCGIIRSIFTWGDVPSCYFYEDYVGTIKIFRSLDGKQRCYAICDFMMDKFEFKRDPSLTYPSAMDNMCGKFFSELTQHQQNTISSFELTFKIFQEHLNNLEVDDFFQHFQDARPTSIGEILNANSSKFILQLKALHNKLENDDDPLICHIGKEQRHQHVDILCNIAYLYKNRTITAENIRALRGKKLKDWSNDQDEFNHSEETNFYEHLKSVISTINQVKLKPNVKKDVLPISWFIIKQSNRLHTFIAKHKNNGFRWPTEERGRTTNLIKIRYFQIMSALY